jgi:hypothetical protein
MNQRQSVQRRTFPLALISDLVPEKVKDYRVGASG